MDDVERAGKPSAHTKILEVREIGEASQWIRINAYLAYGWNRIGARS